MTEEGATKVDVKEETTVENGQSSSVVEVEQNVNEEQKDVKDEPKEANAKEDIQENQNAEREEYKKLVSLNMKPAVANAFIKLFDEALLTPEDVDERAVEILNTLPENQATYICDQLHESKLYGVQNKAQYLTSLIRNFKDRVRSLSAQAVLGSPLITGPVREKMQEIIDRTGYSMEVTIGQRKYGGPCPDWDGPTTFGQGHEVYIGHIPHDLFEDSIIPVFEKSGKIWDLRLMMDPMTGKNRGYAFLTYCEKKDAAEAAKTYDGYEILPGKTLKVNVSVANTRLFLGNIPKSKTKDEILEELKNHAEGISDVIVHTVPDATEKHKNRGFCFVDFIDHKTASDVRRKIQQHKVRPFNVDLYVDWAEQQDEPDDETMSKVKVLYVRNIKEVITEEKLQELFKEFGELERVKKIKDYAFVHFKERDDCLKAMEAWNGKELEGVALDCSLAKPQGDKKKRPARGRQFNAPVGLSGPAVRGRPANFYPNVGYDNWGGYGEMYGGGGYDSFGGYGGGGDFGYGGYGGFNQGMFGGPRGRGRGRGGPRGGGGGGRGRGKRPGDRVGGPASKRENGAPDFSADVNMSSF